ncbi:MAG: RHS repeat-associated core domain-containing protein, partial [Chloroflexi bacterium]|nr:RHS repeat-associated core domain-containing protein [Chloroflexota bacterium]
AETEKVFDELGRVTDIVHERAATDFADYDLTWDAASRISDFDFDSLVGDDGDAAYSYDDTNQLTASDYASDWQTDESYTYDDNGNRTNTGYTTGDHNRLTSDGTYNYTYDNEGNVLTKTNISDSTSVEYTWDHRNRLTKVTFKNSGGSATKIVEYAYDHGQRWVRKTLDTNADGTIESSQVFVHDNGQIVLDFQKTGTAAASNSDLANRYLWGTNVDELLTDELVDDGAEDDNRWALADHLNSVRDLVVYNPVTGTVSVVKHVAYDAFGNVTSDSAAAVKSLFLYTARPFDADTNLQNNLNRWYDLSTGRWMSVDPIGLRAGDTNVYRYVRNSPITRMDPFGLKCKPVGKEFCTPWRPSYLVVNSLFSPGGHLHWADTITCVYMKACRQKMQCGAICVYIKKNGFHLYFKHTRTTVKLSPQHGGPQYEAMIGGFDPFERNKAIYTIVPGQAGYDHAMGNICGSRKNIPKEKPQKPKPLSSKPQGRKSKETCAAL